MLSCQRHLFSIPEEITYLNTAYMSPQLKSVSEAGRQAMQKKSRPWEITVEDFFAPVHRLKALFNSLIEGESPERVALIPSASYGLATVARNLNPSRGDEIVLIEEQFPSNVLSWQRLARESGARILTVPAPPSGPHRGPAWNQAVLDAIGANTYLVAMGHVHWADGTWFDLQKIREKTRSVGAFLVIDGTQSLGALPFSIRELDPDALICGGYKWLMGPYSLGLAYYGPAFDGGTPIEENWYNRLNSEHFGGLVKYQEQYGPLARRYSVGESSNFALVPMLTRALEQIREWKVENIAAYSRSITQAFVQQAREAGLHLSDPPERSHHLLGLMLPEAISLDVLKAKLQEEKIFVSIRGNAIRISAHVYNRQEEFSRLFEVLVSAQKRRMR